MAGRLEGRLAVVTGAAGGIGRALVQGLLGAGIRVAAVDRAADGLAALAASARAAGNEAALLTIAADLSLAPAVADIWNQTRRRFGRIDILVNNAGIGQATLRATTGSGRCASGRSRRMTGAALSRCIRRRRCSSRRPSCRR